MPLLIYFIRMAQSIMYLWEIASVLKMFILRLYYRSMRFVWGIIIFLVGLLFIVKTDTIQRINGRVVWAERHLGTSGGTRLFYKLIGLLLIIISFMLVTNLAGNFLLLMVGPIFRLGI